MHLEPLHHISFPAIDQGKTQEKKSAKSSTPWTTAADLIKRNGPLRQICFGAIGQCKEFG
jgi:hypothetical protein